MARKSPLTAAGLSFVMPGLGHIYAGKRSQGTAYLCITAGIWAGIGLALSGPPAMRSHMSAFLFMVLYPLVLFPAMIEASQAPKQHVSQSPWSEKPWYIIVMMLCVGPPALPMLWASKQFSRSAKIIWAAAVLILFFSCIFVLLVIVPWIERWLGKLSL